MSARSHILIVVAAGLFANAAHRASSSPAPVRPSVGRGARLHVVFAPDDTPAPGAIVRFVAVPAEPAFTTPEIVDAGGVFAAADAFESIPGQPPRALTTLLAGADGCVDLPAFPARAAVMATANGRSGDVLLTAGQRGRLIVRLNANLAVLVVDAAGVPQPDVPVVVCRQAATWPARVSRARTGNDGTAQVPLPADDRELRASSGDEPWTVQIALPLAERVTATVDGDTPPRSPVRLVLPETGTLTVRLIAAGDKPFLWPAVVGIRQPVERPFDNERLWMGDALRRGGTAARMATGPDGVVVSAVNGTATFPRVGVRSHVVIHVQPLDPGFRGVERTMRGPDRAGAADELDILCGARGIRVTGRLLASDRRPAASALLTASLAEHDRAAQRASGFDQQQARAYTGADGRFAFYFDAEPGDYQAPRVAIDLSWAQLAPEGRSEFENAISVSPGCPAADLADIVLPPRRVLAAGTVVDAAGAPLPGVTFSLDENATPSYLGHARAHDSDANGHFEFEGDPAGIFFTVMARLDGWYMPAAQAVERGDHNVRIVMNEAGGIEGSFAPHRADDPPCDVFLREDDGAGTATAPATRTRGRRIELAAAGRWFGSRTLRPGTFALQARLRDSGLPVLNVDHLVIRAGEVNRDPRIQNIDLRELMNVRVITITDDAGQPLSGVRVAIRPTERPRGHAEEQRTNARGVATFAPAPPAIDVVVAATGWQSAVRTQLTANTTIALQRALGLPFVVKLGPDVARPPAPFELTARAYWMGPVGGTAASIPDERDPRNEDLDPRPIGADGTATLVAREPGVYSVRVALTGKTRRGVRTRTLALAGAPQLLTVTGDGTPSIVVTPVPTALAAAVARFTGE